MNINDIFASRIAAAIKASKYTQKELATELGISEGNITNWKKGDNLPSLETMCKLAILLGNKIDYLVGIEANNCNPPADKPKTAKRTKPSKEVSLE